ncbi:amidohydrolase [Haloechinothrix sp. LS1_15]|uniref:amidohydrolase family protein n=1 Tax=Haloechinothrix sp. LS1_15 TaxID=2652248 RepID=UPI0029444713|nr:amidohydrolase [Haloechinothrix sp. LS1_15]MDV6011034.1 amidohydrolase [Haloechinothrix sp. LS1_15]
MTVRFHAPIVLPCGSPFRVLRDATVDVDGSGTITYCGPRAAAPGHEGITTVELTGILLPGLINAHAHSPMTVLRGMGGDLPLMRWLREVIFPAEARLTPADVHAGMVLGSLEMLRHGVTTSAEMYYQGEQMADAVLRTGGRMLLAGPIIDLPGIDWRATVKHIDNWIDTDGRFIGPADRIELGYGPHSAYMLPADALRAVADSARERGALVQIHAAETTEEDTEQRASHGSVPRLLDEVGMLDARIVLAHAVHVSAGDIDLLSRSGACVAHCPGSNAKLASGIAPLAELLAANIPVGLGTDGPASNDDLDMMHEVQLAAMLARLATGDSTAIRAERALLLATRDAATALGREDIGVLEPGRWADLVHVHLDDPAFPRGADAPDAQLIANLVWGAGSRRVTDVWVAGEQVVADGESTRVDRAAAQADVSASAARLHG